MLFTLLYFIFIVSVTIQSIYYIFLFGNFSFQRQQKTRQNIIPVSVIVCARNEAENLRKNLSAILDQNHANFEVIVVNDASGDETLSILHSFERSYNNLNIIDIKPTLNYSGHKKNAITLAIAAACHDTLLFTDADCKPVSSDWIREMTSPISDYKIIVLGYGAYEKIKGSFLNKIIRFETLLTAIQYFSYAQIGTPYMGVGRNLAYTKNVFLKANGFTGHSRIRSGDDDLLINEIATKNNTTICLSNNSFTISEAKKTLITWFHQKRRHVTTAHHYKPIHQFLLGLFYLSQFLFWVLAIILLAFSFNWLTVTILLTIRLIIQYSILGKAAQKFNEKDLILLFPLLDLMLVIVQLGVFVSSMVIKPRSW